MSRYTLDAQFVDDRFAAISKRFRPSENI